MTTVDVEHMTLVRGFEMPLADAWDGRTLDVRIVPYGEPATVADPPDFTPYREMFVAGVFARQLSTPGRDKVWLNVEHEQGFRAAVGHSLSFRDGDDGLHGSFGLDNGPDGDKALRLVSSGFLHGLSLEFRALSSRRVDGVVQRLRAQLDKVSLCRYPAYESASVLAVREEADEVLDEETQPVATPIVDLVRSDGIDSRLKALGFEPLDGTMSEDELRVATANVRRLPREQRAAEARRLIRYYRQAGKEAPVGLRQLAASA